MRRAAILVLLLSGCAPAIAPAPRTAPMGATMTGEWLAAHNRARAAFGSPPMTWDPALARQAVLYAHRLARMERLVHSAKAERPGQGENLWIGTRGAYGPAAMIGGWTSEQRHFRHGVFPAVSRTGNWRDVGHYTQIVWPTSTRLGCGLASSPRWDVLVCRYAPPGNRDGTAI